MEKADVALTISGFGFLVSVSSFVLALYAARRDKEKLRATSRFYPSFYDEDREAVVRKHITVEAVNSGRRPIIFTAVGVDYEDGDWKAVFLKHPDGVRLNEKEQFKVPDDDLDFMIVDSETGRGAANIWFEDTLGNRHYVKGATAHLNSYFKERYEKPPKEPTLEAPKK